MGRSVVFVVLATAAMACGSRTGLRTNVTDVEPCGDAGATRACATICGQGVETCVDGFWKGCTAPKPRPPALVGTIRDFREAHPDFEFAIGDDPGIVRAVLGPDDKPVYASSGTTPTTNGKERFDEWYRDVPGVNLSAPLTLPLSAAGGGLYAHDDPAFFPIDGQLFGNEGHEHNFHFTFEVSTRFRYQGGEVFSFTGDDDLWVFVNRRLVIDLGGVHSESSASVGLDSVASEVEIAPGGTYPLHLFFAERHMTGSHFRVRTTISELDLCD